MGSSELKNLIESGEAKIIDLNGLRVKQFPNGVLNVMERDETLDRARLEEFRMALHNAGYIETKSWVATQGASWFGPGMFAGVSMRIKKVL